MYKMFLFFNFTSYVQISEKSVQKTKLEKIPLRPCTRIRPVHMFGICVHTYAQYREAICEKKLIERAHKF